MSEILSAIGLSFAALGCGFFGAFGVYYGIHVASKVLGPLHTLERNRENHVHVRTHCLKCDGEIGGAS